MKVLKTEGQETVGSSVNKIPQVVRQIDRILCYSPESMKIRKHKVLTTDSRRKKYKNKG
jgi:hypothetical protein